MRTKLPIFACVSLQIPSAPRCPQPSGTKQRQQEKLRIDRFKRRIVDLAGVGLGVGNCGAAAVDFFAGMAGGGWVILGKNLAIIGGVGGAHFFIA